MMMRQLWITVLCLGIWVTSQAQSDLSVFSATGRGGVATTFVTDYQSVGINPANLGMIDSSDLNYSLGFLESSATLHSDALTKKQVRENLLTFPPKELSEEERFDAAAQFAGEGFAMNIDIMPVGFGAQFPKVGGFAFTSRFRTEGFMTLNETASHLFFEGYNYDSYFDTTVIYQGDTLGVAQTALLLSQALIGTRISLASYMEYSLSYGRHIIDEELFEIYAGGGVKYIEGYGMVDVEIKSTDVIGYSAVTPRAPVEYGADLPDRYTKDSSLSPVGTGYGFDMSASAVIKDRIRVGASVVDIGEVTWDANVLSLKDNIIDSLSYAGADNYNIFEQLKSISGEEVFHWADTTKVTRPLPTKLRLGASIKLLNDKLHVGADAIVPLNDAVGNINDGVYGIGGDYFLGDFVRVSSGVTYGGNYGFNVPAGVSFYLGAKKNYELGVSTRDLTIFLGQKNPTFSLSTGFLRFRF